MLVDVKMKYPSDYTRVFNIREEVLFFFLSLFHFHFLLFIMALHYIIAFLIFLKLIVSYLKSNTQPTKDEQEEKEIIDNKVLDSEKGTKTVNYLSILGVILSK